MNRGRVSVSIRPDLALTHFLRIYRTTNVWRGIPLLRQHVKSGG